MNKFVVPAVAAFALVAGSAVAADQQSGQQAGQKAPQAGQHELIGMEVVGQEGEDIGEVSNVLINEQGQVESVILQRGVSLLGIGADAVALPFDQIELPKADPAIASDEQQAKVNMTNEQISELPEFESTRAERDEGEQTQPGATESGSGTTGTTGEPAGQQQR